MRRVYIKEDVCIGCHLCEVYCQLEHSRSKDLIKAFKKESPKPLPRLRVEENGAVSISVRCQQCNEAPCVQACITGALTRDLESGLVTVDEDRCIGCYTCMLACPLGAMKQDAGQKKVLKCELCQGEETPACVANCPNEALICVEVAEDNISTGKRAASPVN